MSRSSFKSVLWVAHRWTGLAIALIFLSTLGTGILLMFQREAELTGAAHLAVASPSLRGLDLAANAVTRDPAHRVPTFLSPAPDRLHAWQLVSVPASGDDDAAVIESVDPKSGTVLSRRNVQDTAASALLRLHMSLYAGWFGHLVVLLMALTLVTLGISGFTISSARWRTLRANPLRATDRWRALHRWCGVLGAALLLLWGGTGMLLIGRIVLDDWSPQTPPRPLTAVPLGVTLETILTNASFQPDAEVSGISLPTSVSPTVDVTLLQRAAAPWRKYSHVRLDPANGVVVERAAGETSAWGRIMAAADSIHKGQSDPLVIHYLYAVALLFPLVLVISGPVAWALRRWRARRAKVTHAAA